MTLLLVVLTICFIPPLLKAARLLIKKLFFIELAKPYTVEEVRQSIPLRFLAQISQLEYLFYPIRYYLIGWPMTIGMVVLIGFMLAGETPVSFIHLIYLILLSYVFLLSRSLKSMTDLKIAELLRIVPDIHPEDFFSRYKWELTFGGTDLLEVNSLRRVSPDNLDFRQNERARQSYWVTIKAVIDTVFFSFLAMHVFKKLGTDYGTLVFDNIGAMWGKRVLQHTCCSFSVKGLEQVQGLSGRCLLVFNHKSSLDFALSFFALSQIRINGRPIRIRFVVARDHFKENPFIYRILGIGKAIESAGMVFVSRRKGKKGLSDIKDAAKVLSDNELDIAIYPQGTRASGNFDRAMKRRDAGYYTTISKNNLTSPQSHLRKGTSYLIYDTLDELYTSGRHDTNLNLVFIGINGAGVAMPKNIYKIQTETDIEFRVGDVVTLSPEIINEVKEVDDEKEMIQRRKQFISHMNELIDDRLVNVLGIHSHLTQRYLTELKGQFKYDDDKIDRIHHEMRDLSRDTHVIFQILDRIYSLPLSLWNGYLSQLAQLLLEKSQLDRLHVFLEEISEELIRAK